jgi:phage shock protein A
MEVQADVVNYGKAKSLEKQFLDLERSEQIDAELNDLKNSLEKEPAPSAQN